MFVHDSIRKRIYPLGWCIVSFYQIFICRDINGWGIFIVDDTQGILTRYVYFSYEGGRITQKGDGSKTCAVSVSKAMDGDNGKWTCQISTMDKANNADSSSADVDVTVAGNYI